MMASCPDCGAALRQDTVDDYVACAVCGTYVLQARYQAEADNAAYFDEHFHEVGKARLDQRKLSLFRRIAARDAAARAAERAHFQKQRRGIQALLRQPGRRVLEIGFGAGDLLAQLLQAGVAAWGEDLSQTAVANFQQQFPAFADRVASPGALPGAFDVIYCAALFEHLDEPGAFLRAVRQRLTLSGCLILDPVPLAMPGAADLTPAEDICFWKPCHRILHSREGLQRVARAAGFDVETVATWDDYGWRVLSLHKRMGYPAVETTRNSLWQDVRLPGLWTFFWICWRARHIGSLCHAAAAILRVKPDQTAEGTRFS